jgi:uncharacterized membrane protein YgdD (TMEM256/DUF423 family)
MHKKFLAIAAILGGLAVALGAFGAHGLERLTTDVTIIQGFRTGTQYQMYHALALLLIAGLYDKFSLTPIKWAANCFITGTILFSGSLYLLTYLKIQEIDAVKIAGPVTPVGGLFLISGWIFLLAAAIRKN